MSCTELCLHAAYEALIDPEKRKIYDRYGEDGLKQHEGGGGAGPQDIFSQYAIHASLLGIVAVCLTAFAYCWVQAIQLCTAFAQCKIRTCNIESSTLSYAVAA